MQLQHRVGDGRLVEARRAVLEQWATFLSSGRTTDLLLALKGPLGREHRVHPCPPAERVQVDHHQLQDRALFVDLDH